MTTCGFPPRCPFCWVAIVLLLPYRQNCPIAFRPGSVHRPAIARRLPPGESRRQSPLVPSSRPACRIDGRGDAWDGTGDGGRGGERGADVIGRVQRKSQLGFRQFPAGYREHRCHGRCGDGIPSIPSPHRSRFLFRFSRLVPLDFDSILLAVGICDGDQLVGQLVYVPGAFEDFYPYFGSIGYTGSVA